VAEIERSEGYPDRTVYAITDAGREVAHAWLREMLSSTDNEYPEFIAALSILFGLPSDEAQAELELQAQRLSAALAHTDAMLTDAPAGLPRLFLLEEEYRQAMLKAELAWIRAVIEDLRSGRLTWSEQWLREIAAAFIDENDDQNQEDR
jgi:DNA-binding PadR family transcriptional regulator